MKHFKLVILIVGLILFSCNKKTSTKDTTYLKVDSISTNLKDKDEIQNLIRKTLAWTDSKNSFDLLPVLTDSTDSFYIGFDLEKHKENLEKLRKTNFFATEFIENYNQIILTLDKKLRNKEYDTWLVGDLPTFPFANDFNPWCLCQDNSTEITGEPKIVKTSDKFIELKWNWGYDSGWKDFKIRVVKIGNVWKITYMEGFDFKESTKN